MATNIVKSTFYITLFEKQLVRSYLLSDNGDFIKSIANYYSINIITSKALESLVDKKIKEFNLDTFTKITIFENYKENIAIQIMNSVFRFSNKSPTTIQTINLQRSLGSSVLKTILRFAIYGLVSNSIVVKKFLRNLYYLLVNLKNINVFFKPSLNLYKEDVLFITSLCPLRGQDIPIGAFFKKRKVKIIGSVRSWDNLSFSIFQLIPEYFLCHSEYMLNNAIYKQGIEKDKILMSVTPSYQSRFLSNTQTKEKVNFVNFSYMCQGRVVNPDDENFVKWLVGMWKEMPKHFMLYIVQHPSFIMNDLQIDLPDNIKLIVFNYEDTTLDKYYNHLSHMDLVFGGGTTGLLDASFLGIPVLAIKFEVIDQNFWQSSLRHFDYFSWTSDFFIEAKVPIANSEFELKKFILNYTNISQIDKVAVIKFTGNPNLDISEVLLSKIITFN